MKITGAIRTVAIVAFLQVAIATSFAQTYSITPNNTIKIQNSNENIYFSKVNAGIYLFVLRGDQKQFTKKIIINN